MTPETLRNELNNTAQRETIAMSNAFKRHVYFSRFISKESSNPKVEKS